MAICKCPECGYDKLSTLARECPVCGIPYPFGNGPAHDGMPIGGSPIMRVERLEFGHAKGEPLSWLVIDTEPDEGIALVISERVIAKQAYADTDLTWMESDLHTWMVEDFAYGYLSSDEQALIVGEPFILTARQAECLGSDTTRKAWPTAELAAKGGPIPGEGTIPYWLCTRGSDCGNVQIVTAQGRVYAHGIPPDDDEIGVRPAMWIRLSQESEDDC